MTYQYPLSDFFRVTGSGGGGGGGKGGGKKGGGESDPNTLRSKARARMLEAISEGPIVGLVDEAGNVLTGDNIKKGIFFDQTPVWNADGSENFKNVLQQQHFGHPDEGWFNGQDAVETPHSVEVRVRKNTGPVQRTIVDENADAVRVIVRLPSLVKNDSENGGLKRTSVSYAFEVRGYNGTWQRVITNNVNNQKATSPFQIAHRIALPANGSPWDLRMVRLTDDSEDTELQNETWWEGYITLVEGKFTYPHTAMVGMEVNAEDMGSSIPPRAYRVRGLIVNVPSNYNPDTREYTGIWDGTFKYAWTNNPAWIFYDLLVNDRYGLGEFINPAIIDKWSLYTIAQYCDQLVRSGYKNGDTGEDIWEPRFTFNGVINSRDDAYFVLQQVSTAWRGMAYWSLGQVFATADMPTDPVRLVSPANVLSGEFSYSGTALKARHSVIIVSWNDPNDFYRPATEIVINQDMLNKYGWREKRLQLTGCTSRGLAHRYGKWILDTEQNETETIEYQASWDHVEVRPGDVVAVADPRKAQVRLGGRIVAHDGLKLTLDYDFEALDGQSYDIIVTMPDGSLEKRPVAQFLDQRTLLVATEFPETALPNAMFAILGDVVPRTYRVLSVDETEPNIFKITGLFHDPNKFARVEQDVVFEPLPYKRDTSTVQPPTNLLVKEIGYVSNGQGFHSLHLSWTPPADFMNRGFLVSVVVPDGGTQLLGQTMSPWFEMQNTGVGLYKFMVQTIGFNGVPSNAASFEFTAAGPDGFAMPTVTELRLKDNPGANIFAGTDLAIEWHNNFATSSDPIVPGGTPSHVPSPHYTFNTIKVFNNATGALLRSARVTGESFVYDLATNAHDSAAAALAGPSRSLRIEVTVSDIFGRESAVASAIFSNPAPAVVTPSFTPAGATVVMSYPLIADPDFRGVKVWRSDAPGVDTSVAPHYDGQANPLTMMALPRSTYYFRVGAYDAFSQADMVISGEFSVTTGFDVTDLDPPAKPTGLELTTRVETVDGIATRMLLRAEVTLNTEEDFASYDFEIKEGSGNWLSFSSATNVYEWPIMPTQTYQVRVRALDRSFNPSVRTDVETIVAPTHPGLAEQINSGSTTIDPGKIRVSGATTLADWRRGGDETKIDGGALSANTVSANKMTIGQRGINLEGVEFEHNNPAPNQVSWTAGQISYVNDAGAAAVVDVSAGSASWTGPALYVFWTKDTTSLQATSVFATAMHANNIILAVYRGDRDLNANYGRTVIDGAIIKTGTVQAEALVAQNLSAISADLGDITAGRARSADSKMIIDFNSKFISIEV